MTAISSLSSALGSGASLWKRTSYLSLMAVGSDNASVSDTDALRLQYFPESITDSKGINWGQKDIPGASLPLYQWTSSGARTISFTAVFSTDVDFSLNSGGPSYLSLTGESLKNRNVDIRGAVSWLRSFSLPSYNDTPQNTTARTGGPITSAPKKLVLHIPNSGIGMAHGGITGQHDGPDFITTVMTTCQVTWEKFFPSGMPRLASVSLAFDQVAQIGGGVVFPSARTYGGDRETIAGTTIFEYTLTAPKAQ